MPQIIRVVAWHQYQHYKDRNPPWIKLYPRLIDGDSREFGRLKDEEKWQFLAIMMLASRQQNAIPLDVEWISERLRLRKPLNLKALEATGLIEIVEVASNTLADCKQDAMPETETEKRQRRVETEVASAKAPAAHVKVFQEEAQKAGIAIAMDKPDFIKLAEAFKTCGSEDEYRRVCALWFASDDEWIKDKWGYAGRFIGKKLQALLNNGHSAKPRNGSGFSTEYEAKLLAERLEFNRRVDEGIDLDDK